MWIIKSGVVLGICCVALSCSGMVYADDDAKPVINDDSMMLPLEIIGGFGAIGAIAMIASHNNHSTSPVGPTPPSSKNLGISLDQDPNDIHLGYSAIQIKNETTTAAPLDNVAVTISDATSSKLGLSDKIKLCSPIDNDCVYKTDANCVTGGTIAANSSCKMWFKALDSNSVKVGTGTIRTQITGSFVADATFNFNYDMALYAGGFFTATKDASLSVSRVAKWNGTTWSTLAEGVGGDPSSTEVTNFTILNGDLIAGGLFTTAGTVAANNIAKWNGVTWSALGNGTDNLVWALTTLDSNLYAGGVFSPNPADFIAKWDGMNWSALGTQINDDAYALTTQNGNLYAGGGFILTPLIPPPSYVAKWDGSNWSNIGNVISGFGGQNVIRSLTFLNNNLFAGGVFGNIGGVDASNIAKWDGSNWSALGAGRNSIIRALTVTSSNNLYAGGGFTNDDGVTGNEGRIAKWDGTNWSALGLGLDCPVYGLTSVGTNVFAGGCFSQSGTTNLENIAKWNETTATWSALASGLNNTVIGLIVAPSIQILNSTAQ